MSPAFDERTARALTTVAAWSAGLRWDDVDEDVRDRLALVLFDTVAVARAGAALAENRRLRTAWPSATGAASVFDDLPAAADRAAWLNGTAAVALELDEASRVTRGHAASHTVFAVLAAAQERGASAGETCAALLAGHEVASRVGRSVTMAPGLHPHGSWAGLGAAAGAARVAGLDTAGTAVALDVAGGLMLAAPWACAPGGSPVRNLWVGFANQAGLIAARVARARDDDTVHGVVHPAFTLALGELRAEEIDRDLGVDYAVRTDFIKRHAACGYSHAVLDVVLDLVATGRVPRRPDEIDSVLVRGTSLTAELDVISADTRMGALFSLPYLVAAAIALGETGPAITEASTRTRPDVLALAARVKVEIDPELEARMPLDRGARVEITPRGGDPLAGETPNARWDPRHFPATWDDVLGKAERLLGPLGVETDALHRWVLALTAGTGSVADLDSVLTPTASEES